jgi:hypothetical protein
MYSVSYIYPEMQFVLYISFCSSANSEGIDQANSCTSSSNESVSSPPVWNTDNLSSFPADSPQKSKRGKHQVIKDIGTKLMFVILIDGRK